MIVVGIGGGVASGKTTFANKIANFIGLAPKKIISTDSFLYPNAVLEQKGILERKGFPESYDTSAMRNFFKRLTSPPHQAKVPVYSHSHYDIVPGEFVEINAPDVLIIEGINVLETFPDGFTIRDYLNLSIFIDAAPADMLDWFLKRQLELKHQPHLKGTAFYEWVKMSDAEFLEFAARVFEEVNLKNYRQFILPSKKYAQVIVNKSSNHQYSFAFNQAL
jgi:type I pantothenate kinase